MVHTVQHRLDGKSVDGNLKYCVLNPIKDGQANARVFRSSIEGLVRDGYNAQSVRVLTGFSSCPNIEAFSFW